MIVGGPRTVLAIAVLILAVTAACGGDPEPTDDAATAGAVGAASPLADCASLTAPPPAAGANRAGSHDPLPAVTLPCFAGGQAVSLADLAGPAVVNLWASWCGPCRQELPVLQRYADEMDGRVHVVGVVTQDSRAGAAAFAAEAGVTFPALYDREGELLVAIAAVGLPATLFVGGDGEIRYLHNRELDDEALRRHAEEHLGVGLP
jgi:thiol-disulfide isomerase/thioredoxin